MSWHTALFFYMFLIFNISLYAKNILVTGGAGFIGSHVTEMLLNRGDNVFVIDNMNDFYNPLLKFNNIESIRKNIKKRSGSFYFFQFDINDIQALEAFFKAYEIDVICHLAARAGVQPSIEDPILYAQANVLGTICILEMARKYNIPHVVLASSSSVYGDNTPVPFAEDSVPNILCSPYAATKRAVELLSSTYYHLYNISCTCLRFFTVYGPRGRVDMSPFKFLHAIYNEIPLNLCGDGSTIRDYTYIEDIVDGVIKAIDKPVGFEIINLGRGEPITLKSFIQVIESITNKKAIIRQLPLNMGDVAITHANIDKAREILDYVPHTSVQNGMEKMYEWYINVFLKRTDLVKSLVAL